MGRPRGTALVVWSGTADQQRGRNEIRWPGRRAPRFAPDVCGLVRSCVGLGIDSATLALRSSYGLGVLLLGVSSTSLGGCYTGIATGEPGPQQMEDDGEAEEEPDDPEPPTDDGEDAECPPLDHEFRAVPVPTAQLSAELARALGLETPVVRDLLQDYALGYGASADFDNRDTTTLIVANTTETLLPAMEALSELWLAGHDDACSDAGCGATRLDDAAQRLRVSADVRQSAGEVFDNAMELGLVDEALGLGVTRMLMSPEVLFMGANPDQPSAHVRLAATLGSRSLGPDEQNLPVDELLDDLLAGSAPDVLAERFALRWLGVDKTLSELEFGDPDLLPVEPEILESLREEARLFFWRWVSEDAPLSALVSSETTFLNETLASYYGIDGVVGDEFREVETQGKRDAGLLSLGAVHLATGASSETSVVVRGHWMLDNFLCFPLPPPPDPNEVAEVEAELDDTAPAGETPRQRSEARRAVPTCAGCHNIMDEVGFGLESFDAWGAAREEYPDGSPVEAYGQLPTGESFMDYRELADALQTAPEFQACVTRKLATYLVGRELNASEQCRIDALASELDADLNAQDWIRLIVDSGVVGTDEGGKS